MSARRKQMMLMGAKMVAQHELGRAVPDMLEQFATSSLQAAMRSPEAEAIERRNDQTGAEDFLAEVDANSRSLASFCFAWATTGFPMVSVAHRLAASLMATTVPMEAVPDIQLPWRAFVVAVQPGILPCAACGDDVQSIGALQGETRSVIGAVDSDGVTLDATDHATRVDVLLRCERGHLHRFWYPSVRAMAERWTDTDTEASSRIAEVACRLMLGVCIEMDQPKRRIVIGEGRAREVRTKRGEPRAWTFELGRPVTVDCREWVTAYLRGGRGVAPSVQTIVRGHHKRQRCGLNGVDRMWIHIEPYWRGPEDAPIAVREHHIVGREAAE